MRSRAGRESDHKMGHVVPRAEHGLVLLQRHRGRFPAKHGSGFTLTVAGIQTVIPRKLQAAARLARHRADLPCDWRLLAALAVPPFLLGLRDGFRALRGIVGMMFGWAP